MIDRFLKWWHRIYITEGGHYFSPIPDDHLKYSYCTINKHNLVQLLVDVHNHDNISESKATRITFSIIEKMNKNYPNSFQIRNDLPQMCMDLDEFTFMISENIMSSIIGSNND